MVEAPKQEVVSIFLTKKQSMIGFTVHSGVQHYCKHAFTLTTPYTHTHCICRTALISEMSCISVGLLLINQWAMYCLVCLLYVYVNVQLKGRLSSINPLGSKKFYGIIMSHSQQCKQSQKY